MERRQFIDEVIAEPTSTFEKATKLRKVGVCFDTALRTLCKRRKPNDETSTAKTDVLERVCDRNVDDPHRHPASDLGDSGDHSD